MNIGTDKKNVKKQCERIIFKNKINQLASRCIYLVLSHSVLHFLPKVGFTVTPRAAAPRPASLLYLEE